MPGQGVHFALTPAYAERLLAAADDAAISAMLEELEQRGTAWSAASEGAWDAMHRALSNGTLYYDEGEYPLNRVLLGGKHLFAADDFVVAYAAPNEVKDAAGALEALTEPEFRKRYDLIDPDEYDGEQGDADFRVVWEKLQLVRDLFKKAAAEGRAVVFTVDQ